MIFVSAQFLNRYRGSQMKWRPPQNLTMDLRALKRRWEWFWAFRGPLTKPPVPRKANLNMVQLKLYQAEISTWLIAI